MCPRCHTPVAIADPIPVSPVVPTYPPVIDSPERELKLPPWLWPALAGFVTLFLVILLVDDLRLRMHRNLSSLAPPSPAPVIVIPPVNPVPVSKPPTPAVEMPPVVVAPTVEAPPPVVAPPPPPPPTPSVCRDGGRPSFQNAAVKCRDP